MENTNRQSPIQELETAEAKAMHRRKFLTLIGGTATAAAVIASCKKSNSNNGIDLGSGDIGILNYAYALEQLEAAFYTQVAMSFYSGASAMEQTYLQDIRDHEIAHREFFKNALGSNAIQDLEVDFSSINFSSRDSVLGAAKAFEDLGVSAYNGAGKLITDPNYLLVAGKIVSVEARHAAIIRDLISFGSFADNTVIDANGLDKHREPGEVLSIASAYLKSKIDASRLPTS
jgi:rubrerythrin